MKPTLSLVAAQTDEASRISPISPASPAAQASPDQDRSPGTELANTILLLLERRGRLAHHPFRIPGAGRSEQVLCRVFTAGELAQLAREIEQELSKGSGGHRTPSSPCPEPPMNVSPDYQRGWVDGFETAVHMANESLAQAAPGQNTQASPQFHAPEIADAARVLAWAKESPRRPASSAFTAGAERQAAYWIEWAQNQEGAKAPTCTSDALHRDPGVAGDKP